MATAHRASLTAHCQRLTVDHAREHAAQGLDAQRQRRDVEQQDVLDVAAQHAALDGRAHGHDLVGVDAAAGVALEDALDDLVDLCCGGRGGRGEMREG